MGYSKESERQNKALGDLLSGKTPDKRIMVGYEGKTESGDKISRLSDVMKEARMPMFCPKCDVIMKKRLDDKFWRMYNHCFDCQIKIENRRFALQIFSFYQFRHVCQAVLADQQ
jgi:ribosomal protein L37AE/L43A